MNSEDQSAQSLPISSLGRRQFLHRLGATGAAAMFWPGVADAMTELWEEGDPLCGVPYPPLEKPAGYELDLAYLSTFIDLSETLTGVAPLPRHLANQYMERYALHPQLSKNLDILIQAYRKIPAGKRPTEDDIKQYIMADPTVRAGAKQLIYLWYISAFYIPLDPGLDLNDIPPPLKDDGTDTRKRAWVYGTPEQYGRGLAWSELRAHAPMTPGGGENYWASRPAGTPSRPT
jgi:hypothetical protein